MDHPTVSFLIGSGFSIPYGVKGVLEINVRFESIKENEFYTHTDWNSFFC